MKRAFGALFTGLLASPFLFSVACGGDDGAPPPKTPESPADPGTPPTSTGVKPAATPPASSGSSGSAGTTTTTAALPNGGDLQGAKLVTSSSAQTYEVAGQGGPAPSGGHDPGRDTNDVKTLVAARRDDARKCYDDAFSKHAGIEGDIVIKWKLDPKGAITDISVDDAKSQIKDANLGQCLIGIIKSIHFAASPKGFESTMSYPYNFHPKGAQYQQMRNAQQAGGGAK